MAPEMVAASSWLGSRNGLSSSPTRTAVGTSERAKTVETAGGRGDLDEERGVHRRRRAQELRVAELLIARALGDHSVERRVPERVVDGVEHGLDPGHPLGPCEFGAEGGDLGLEVERAVIGVHEDQPIEAMPVVDREDLGDHAAHRVTEQHEAVPLEGVDQVDEVGGEGRQRVGRLVAGLRAASVAAQVGGDDVPTLVCQPPDVIGEVLLGTGEAVDEEQRPATSPALGDDEARPSAGR